MQKLNMKAYTALYMRVGSESFARKMVRACLWRFDRNDKRVAELIFESDKNRDSDLLAGKRKLNNEKAFAARLT
jgi:hypothetical protein